MVNDIPQNFFVQYQAMRTSAREPYWQDRWTVTKLHPAHFIDRLEQEHSETNDPPGNRQTWVYRILCAVPYFGDFESDYNGPKEAVDGD